MIKLTKQKQKGSILAFAVIIMSFLMIIAIGLAASALLTRKGANVSSNSTSAFQNTDKGMELFLYELYTNTKPYDDLEKLAESIVDSNDEPYDCVIKTDENGNDVAVITGAEFDVISYKEANPSDNDGKDYAVVNSCEREIARVYKMKVTGHFATASRSIEVNLSNSLKRGKIAKWNFEGNAESLRLGGKGCGSNQNEWCVGAPVIKDRSQNDYILTLCPIDGDATLQGTADFPKCPRHKAEDVPNGDIFMHHFPKWYTASIFDKDDNWVKMADAPNEDDNTCRQIDKVDKEETDNVIPCGGYVPGVVNDDPGSRAVDEDDPTNQLGIGTGRPVDPDTDPNSEDYYDYDETGNRIASEALEFNGLTQYLAPNLNKKKHGAVNATNYVKEGAKEGLDLDGSEGLSLSLWINNNLETGGGEDGTEKQVLISKTSGSNNGYELYLEDDKIYFWLKGNKIEASFDSDGWHHVAVRYDSDSTVGGDILIDGEIVASGFAGAGVVKDNEDTLLFIGGLPSKDYFGGMIDNVEIYNRYLIDFEVQKLCNMAEGEGWQSESGSIADLCEDIVW